MKPFGYYYFDGFKVDVFGYDEKQNRATNTQTKEMNGFSRAAHIFI